MGTRERGQQRVLLGGAVVDLHHVVQRRLEQDKLAEEDWWVKMRRRGRGGVWGGDEGLGLAQEKMS